jgi:hypothetical protein
LSPSARLGWSRLHAIETQEADKDRADDAPGPRDAFQSARRPSSFHRGRDRGTSRAAWLHVWFVARRAWSPGPAGAGRGGRGCSDLSPLTREDGSRSAVPHGVSLAAFGSSWSSRKGENRRASTSCFARCYYSSLNLFRLQDTSTDTRYYTRNSENVSKKSRYGLLTATSAWSPLPIFATS